MKLAQVKTIAQVMPSHTTYATHYNKSPHHVHISSWTKSPQAHPSRWSDPAYHHTLHAALQEYATHPNLLTGIGCILSPQDKVGCIDLDNYTTINSHIYALLEPLTHLTYTEVSLSNNGLHLFFNYTKPFNRINTPQIELYPGQSKAFIALTGNTLTPTPTPTPLAPPHVGDQIVQLAQAVASQYNPTLQHDPNKKYRPPKQVYEGERDTQLFRYLCHRRTMHQIEHQAELSHSQLLHIASQFNQERCIPPLPAKEVQIKVHSAMRYSQNQNQNQNPQGAKYV